MFMNDSFLFLMDKDGESLASELVVAGWEYQLSYDPGAGSGIITLLNLNKGR